jgi:hypothetical protein
MTIFLDEDFKCHAADSGGMRAMETDMFEGKCQEYIEGYRYVPEGESWTRSDGVIFDGQMTSAWKSYEELATAQAAYERGLAEADEALAAIVDEIYNSDLGEIENV